MRIALPVAAALCAVAVIGCGESTSDRDSAASRDVLGPTGFGRVHLGDSFAAAQEAATFPLKLGSAMFEPCRSFDGPTKDIYGLMTENVIRVVGTRSRAVRTDKGLGLGMTVDAARERYGDPDRIDMAPYDPDGSQLLWRVSPGEDSAVWLRVITDGRVVTTLEVGYRPEIEYEEGCV